MEAICVKKTWLHERKQKKKKISKLILGRDVKKVKFYDLKETNLRNIPIIAREKKETKQTTKNPMKITGIEKAEHKL